MTSKPLDLLSHGFASSEIKQKTIRGSMITACAQLMQTAISLASMMVLARLLGPEDFGLIAMVTFFSGFASMFVDAGLSMATVQRKEITQHQVSNLFWIATVIGTLLSLLLALASPLIGSSYGEPRLVPISIVISLTFVPSALTIQHQALLRRGMYFGRLAATSIISQVISQAAAITWAYCYFGHPNDYWALVIILLAGCISRMALTWMLCPWLPSRPRRMAGTRQLLNFGANLTGFNFVNYLARNTDNLLIGWYWGPATLGFYDRAYRLFLAPMRTAVGPLSGVMIPALSRLADDREAYCRSYISTLRLLLVSIIPGVLAVGVTAHWWVPLMLGPAWVPSVAILRWLAIVGVIDPFTSTGGWLYISQGKTREMLRLGLISSSSTIVAFVVGLPWGAEGVAAAYGLTGVFFRLPFLLYCFARHEIIDLPKVFGAISCALPPAVLVVVANLYVVSKMGTLPPPSGVAICLAVSFVAWVIGLSATKAGRQTVSQMRAILRGKFNVFQKPTPANANAS